MRQMNIQEVQSELLEIMKDVHAFCIDNNIKYSLAYGSLIGAVRHKGFIPWDDDIDIWMPRSDYERFMNSYHSRRYELKSLKDNDYYMGYTRVYDRVRTYAPENYRNIKDEAGIWIDVFPIDGVSDDETRRNEDFEDSCHERDLSSGFRGDMFKLRLGNKSDKIISAVKIGIKRLLRGTHHSLLIKFEHVCKRHAFGSTKYCANYYCYSAYERRKIELLETDWFINYELVEFEDTKLMITKSYNAVLCSIFGDYMLLPLEDKRHGFHTATFYWK